MWFHVFYISCLELANLVWLFFWVYNVIENVSLMCYIFIGVMLDKLDHVIILMCYSLHFFIIIFLHYRNM